MELWWGCYRLGCLRILYCLQVVDVSKDTVAIRSIDWDRDRFDIEFGYVLAITLSCHVPLTYIYHWPNGCMKDLKLAAQGYRRVFC